MDCSGSIFSILALGKKYIFTYTHVHILKSLFIVFSDSMDALNLANYIAIACLDLGILSLYYIFEWYQRRIELGQDSVAV